MRCARLAANTGRKKVAKNRHLGTIAQLCREMSSQLRHVSTIGKKLVIASAFCTYTRMTSAPALCYSSAEYCQGEVSSYVSKFRLACSVVLYRRCQLFTCYGRPIGQAIIFCSCGFFFLLFPRLFWAIAVWMSIILPHMMWP